MGFRQPCVQRNNTGLCTKPDDGKDKYHSLYRIRKVTRRGLYAGKVHMPGIFVKDQEKCNYEGHSYMSHQGIYKTCPCRFLLRIKRLQGSKKLWTWFPRI